MTAVGGAPRVTRFVTTAEERGGRARSSILCVRAARMAGQMPRASTTATVASAPSEEHERRRTRSRWRPRPGVPRRAARWGTTQWRAPQHQRHPQCPRPGSVPCRARRAPGRRCPVRPGSGGPHSRRRSGGPGPGRRRPARQARRVRRGSTTRRPADGWTPESWRRFRPGSRRRRWTDCPKIQLSELLVQLDHAGLTLAEAHEVLVLRRRCGGAPSARIPGRRKGGRRVWCRRGTRTHWLSIPTTRRARCRTVRDGSPRVRVVVRRGFGWCFERDVDHGSDVHAVVVLQGEGGQYLIGLGGVGHVARHECRERRSPAPEHRHAEVIPVDRVRAVARRDSPRRARRARWRR